MGANHPSPSEQRVITPVQSNLFPLSLPCSCPSRAAESVGRLIFQCCRGLGCYVQWKAYANGFIHSRFDSSICHKGALVYCGISFLSSWNHSPESYCWRVWKDRIYTFYKLLLKTCYLFHYPEWRRFNMAMHHSFKNTWGARGGWRAILTWLQTRGRWLTGYMTGYTGIRI